MFSFSNADETHIFQEYAYIKRQNPDRYRNKRYFISRVSMVVRVCAAMYPRVRIALRYYKSI